MFLQISRKVHLSETDATGIIYFTNHIKYACEAFEEYLIRLLANHDKTLEEGEVVLPVVDVKSSFASPVRWGDSLIISIKELEVKRTSLRVRTEITNKGKLAAKVVITHVAIDKVTGKKRLINELKYPLHQESCTLVKPSADDL